MNLRASRRMDLYTAPMPDKLPVSFGASSISAFRTVMGSIVSTPEPDFSSLYHIIMFLVGSADSVEGGDDWVLPSTQFYDHPWCKFRINSIYRENA
ncbi:hypothetical protein PAECIP111802_01635 [Paenibacillus allorhizosphaerae]|uniref:Uncharacterized protein n=1 Tax=Paenibacillus allorhizosphaerae TaxID=2849866 RepID=A0ABN7TGE1_9BACL|nr:hypothetical protein [Paenibacillus allorhizosphaerae]CAG7630424.1 hypothetical protein PAECIP111802_01635 [Paenibacillus allorhizosphaerae]